MKKRNQGTMPLLGIYKTVQTLDHSENEFGEITTSQRSETKTLVALVRFFHEPSNYGSLPLRDGLLCDKFDAYTVTRPRCARAAMFELFIADFRNQFMPKVLRFGHLEWIFSNHEPTHAFTFMDNGEGTMSMSIDGYLSEPIEQDAYTAALGVK